MTEHRNFRLTSESKQDFLDTTGGYSRAIVVALVQQAIVLVLASLVLDGGQTLRFCALAAIASWVCSLAIMLRRPRRPTRLDLVIVRYGFWPAMPVVFGIGFVLARML